MKKPIRVQQRSTPWSVLALLGLILLVAFLIRWQWRECPLERDEGEYAYIGRLILEGLAPYGVAGNHKFPGTYLAYAAIMAMFGETTAGIHVGLLIVNLFSTILIFFLGRLLASNAAGLAAAAAWAITSVSPGVLGNAGHLTHFVMLAVLAGLLLLWRGIEAEGKWRLICGGLCLGTAVVVRQTSLVFVAFGVLFFWLAARRTQGRAAQAQAGLIALSSAIPIALMGLWLWMAGVFPQFWRWTVTEAAAYGSQMSFSGGLQQFWITTPQAISWNFLLWTGAAIGLGIGFWQRSRPNWFVVGLFFASFIAMAPGLYFRRHYYIHLLPAVALLFGIAVAKGMAMPGLWRRGAIAGATVALLLPLVGQRSYFLAPTPTDLSRRIYGANPFVEAIEVARYIKANSAPDEPVGVLGSEPEIFFYSHRRSATTLIYSYPMMEYHQYARGLQEKTAHELEEKKPKFIVFMNVPISWLARDNSDQFIFTWAGNFLSRYYKPDGIADILESGSEYVWGPAALTYAPKSDSFIRIYRRLD